MKETEYIINLKRNLNKILVTTKTIKDWVENGDNVDFLIKILKDTVKDL